MALAFKSIDLLMNVVLYSFKSGTEGMNSSIQHFKKARKVSSSWWHIKKGTNSPCSCSFQKNLKTLQKMLSMLPSMGALWLKYRKYKNQLDFFFFSILNKNDPSQAMILGIKKKHFSVTCRSHTGKLQIFENWGLFWTEKMWAEESLLEKSSASLPEGTFNRNTSSPRGWYY